MNPIAIQLLYTLETALLFSFITVGLYLSFRILRFPDLTAEGGVGLSAMAGGLVLTRTGSPWLALLAAVATGMATGVSTAVVANVARLPTVLASILTMTMCYSVGLLVAGKPNMALPDAWVFQSLACMGISHPLAIGLVGGSGALLLLLVMMTILLKTGAGCILRTRGETPQLAQDLGHSLVIWDCVGLAVANGICGAAAMLISQRAGYASITMGRGTAISALAAIMLTEAVFPARRLPVALACCVAGTLAMQLVRLFALNLGMPDGGLDLVTSLLIIAFCWIGGRRKSSRGNVLERMRM